MRLTIISLIGIALTLSFGYNYPDFANSFLGTLFGILFLSSFGFVIYLELFGGVQKR
ncbi:hypothetical protein LCGC14_2051910 [marine sediment metagenome]|uniref:Uncharacterized protein n=1 Tax=marine sediment metagenome TaxID=412755 RepID=A0A0F9ENQ2_9ZZZZ